MTARKALAVTLLCLAGDCALILALVGCSARADAQERRALVVPERDAAELLKAHRELMDAQRVYDEAKSRIEKRLAPKDWPCCVFQWSEDFRVLWPEQAGTYRDWRGGGYYLTPGSYSVPNRSTLELKPRLETTPAINPIHPINLMLDAEDLK